jgi:excisionase family DNA binding protein
MLDPNDILTPAELAVRLKVPETWIYEKTRGRCLDPLPCMRIGRYIRFNWTAVVEWLKKGERKDATRTDFQEGRKLVSKILPR